MSAIKNNNEKLYSGGGGGKAVDSSGNKDAQNCGRNHGNSNGSGSGGVGKSVFGESSGANGTRMANGKSGMVLEQRQRQEQQQQQQQVRDRRQCTNNISVEGGWCEDECLNRQQQEKRGWCEALEEQLENLGRGYKKIFGKRSFRRKTTWLAIILGQVLSLLLCVSAFATVQLVETHQIRIPNAQNFAFYMVLATVFTTILACRPADRNLFPILRTRGWKYAFVALADAEANYLITKAYQLTTLTSVQLLDCFTIPTVLSLSWLVLKIRFKVPHILGVSISLLGVSCLVWADIEDGKPIGSIKDRFLGDMLCLAGAFLLGISNITEEFVVKTFDTVEFLGMIGLFGSFVSGTQTVLLEYGAVTEMDFANLYSPPLSMLLVYALARLAFYVVAATVIKYSSATFLNLSCLSADYYSLIISIYFQRVKFHALYFLSYVLVMTGAITFSIKPAVLGSHVYKSLTREHTTTLDLELMASTPSSTGYPLIGNQAHHHHQHGHQQSTSSHDSATGSKTSSSNNDQGHHHHLQEHQQHHNHHQSSNLQDEVCIGGPGSLLISSSGCSAEKMQFRSACIKSSSGGGGGGNTLLSNEGCDVVLQTTATLSRARTKAAYKGTNNGGTSPIPEETC